MSWRDFFSNIRRPPDPIVSFYLPAVPSRKFPPPPMYRLPRAVVSMFVVSGLEAMFPFRFGDKEGYPRDKQSFNETIDQMLEDRDFVFKREVVVAPTLNENSRKTFR